MSDEDLRSFVGVIFWFKNPTKVQHFFCIQLESSLVSQETGTAEDSRSAREKSVRQPAKSMAAVGVLTWELNLTTTGPQHPQKKSAACLALTDSPADILLTCPVGAPVHWMCTKWSFYFWQISREPKSKYAECLLFSVVKSMASHASHHKHKFIWKTNSMEKGKIGS